MYSFFIRQRESFLFSMKQSTFKEHSTAVRYLGNIENPSYMPELQMPFVEPLTFAQRLGNTINYALQVRKKYNHAFKKHLGYMSRKIINLSVATL